MSSNPINKKRRFWGRLCLVLGGPALIILVLNVEGLLTPITKSFVWIATLSELYYYIIGFCVFWGILHLIYAPKDSIANEHLLYKRLGPIASAPLTGATHGIFIHSGIQIVYLICFDSETLKKYDNLDKTTVTITMLAIMIYAVYSMGLIIFDIMNPKDEEVGKIVSTKKNTSKV